MNGSSTARSIQVECWDHRIAYGGRPLGQRSFHSSRRRHDLSRRTGKPSTGRREAGDGDARGREVRAMRDAATVLGIIPERGKQGLPLHDVYPQLYNPKLYLLADAKLYANPWCTSPQ